LKQNWTKVEVEKCLNGNERITDDNNNVNHPEIDTPDYVIETVQKALRGEEKPLTPEQQEIKELKEAVAKLTGGAKKELPKKQPEKKAIEKPIVKTESVDSNDLESVRKQYHEVIGKKPHHAKKLKNLQAEIDAKLAE
jgi:type I site-specific restriction endonuclease